MRHPTSCLRGQSQATTESICNTKGKGLYLAIEEAIIQLHSAFPLITLVHCQGQEPSKDHICFIINSPPGVGSLLIMDFHLGNTLVEALFTFRNVSLVFENNSYTVCRD